MNYFFLLWASCLLTAGSDVILVGQGGDPSFQEQFYRWGDRLEAALVDKLGHARTSVLRPGLKGSNQQAPTLAEIRTALAGLITEHPADQDLTFYLIGHGSFIRGVACFQVPGEDLTAAEFSLLVARIPARRVIIVNASSASAPFINSLSGQGRVICTATKNGSELNATEFMEHWLQSLESGKADQDRDEAISLWEIAYKAASATQTWYRSNRLHATEHALLDDNGDGLGSRLTKEERPTPEKVGTPDGSLAKTILLEDKRFPPGVDSKAVGAYLAKLGEVAKIKDRKQQLSAADYWKALEKALTEAALLNQTIHKGSTAKKGP